MERVSDAEHPGALDVRARLAKWTGWTGDWAGGRDQLLPVASTSPAPSIRMPSPPEPAGLAYWTRQVGGDKLAQ